MTELDDLGITGLPADRDAERALLAKLMFSRSSEDGPDAFDDLGPLSASDFYDPAHAVVFTAMLQLHADGQPTHAQALAAHLEATGDLRRARGLNYLLDLMTDPMAPTAGRWNADRIVELARKRAVIEVGTRLTQMAQQPDTAAADLIAKGAEMLSSLGEAQSTGGAVRWDDLLAEAITDLEYRQEAPPTERGLATGFADLDRLLTGLKPGQLVILGARPAMGKSTLAADILRHAAFKLGVPSLAFAMEMGRVEMALKIIAAQYRIPLHHLQAAELSEDEWVRLAQLSSGQADAPLWIEDAPERTLAQIRAEARRIARMHGLGLLVVDYLGLIKPAGPRLGGSRQQDVADIARGLKVLAKELAVPVVACAQINRGPEQRQDKRPTMADLRESGQIEADADIVILLHREDYYEKECPRQGEADFIVAKHRGGPTDTVTVANQLHFGRFVDMAVGV